MSMRRLLSVSLLALVPFLAAVTLQESPGAQAPAGKTLKVTVNYTGAGTVDADHKLFVFVFNTPEIASGAAMPIAMDSTGTNNSAITFSGLTDSPVYLAVVFDSNGGYDVSQGYPPSGSPATIHGTQPGVADPIALIDGQPVDVQVTLDDSFRVP